ncbi:galectin-8 isoform X3 [Anabrus simplex]|uniref:galectin-8 isoform X3 n=1 Tax=Anabrus simplex TaxID=316456 RepID=UPI0035A2F615
MAAMGPSTSEERVHLLRRDATPVAMGWWRSLLPCCGPKSLPPVVATFCCCCCNAKDGMHDEGTQQQQKRENGEDNFVFLEDYATDEKIVNPMVPFLGELPSQLSPGRMLLLHGYVHPHAIRMSVNLACGSGPTADLAFHLNPRFEQNLVVRNYRIDNRWGKEETSSPKRFPFKRGQQFQLQIFVSEEEFLVAFNGEHFCAFTYRLPLEQIRIIQVNGDIDVNELEYKSAEVYPLPCDRVISPKYKITASKGLSSISKDLIAPPFVAELQEGLPVGSELEVVGRVKLLPHST